MSHVGIGRQLRALDDAVLGDRLRTPPSPRGQWRAFQVQLLAALVVVAVLALLGDEFPHLVASLYLFVVLVQAPQAWRSRARARAERRPV